MLSIGAGELVVMAVIALALLGPPIAVFVWLMKRRKNGDESPKA